MDSFVVIYAFSKNLPCAMIWKKINFWNQSERKFNGFYHFVQMKWY